MKKIELTKETKVELEKFRNSSGKKGSERALYVLLNASGKSIPKIANVTKRDVVTVRKWINRYVEYGIEGLKNKPNSGRPSHRNDCLKPFLEEILEKSPADYGYFEKIWTIHLMIDCYGKHRGVKMSHDTFQRALDELGYSFKRSRLTVAQNAPTKEEKIELVKEIISSVRQALDDGDVEVVFVDEAHINNQPYITRGWSKKKSTPIIANTNQTRRKDNFWRVEYASGKILLQSCKKV